jgi:hypothetical protein
MLLQPPRTLSSAVQVLHEWICGEQALGMLPLPTDVVNLDIAGFRKLLTAISGRCAPSPSTMSARQGEYLEASQRLCSGAPGHMVNV